MKKTIYDVIIIGSGPAGYTAAIYSARGGQKTLLVAGDMAGGQLMLTSEVENFPGFEKGILGPELMENMKDQAIRFGAEFLTEFVTKVDFTRKPYTLYLANEKTIQARSIIIATGSQSRWLGLPSEQKFMGRGVTSCATCDGYFFTDKKVAVVGGGDSAMEEAMTLTKYAAEVIIIHRKGSFRASKIMQDRVLDNSKITVLWNKEVVEVLGDNTVNALKLADTKTSKVELINVDGLFVAIGHIPATKFLNDSVELDDKGYIKPIEQVKTAIEGVFVAGDVADSRYRQAITAAGDGCRAALEAEYYLSEQTA